MNATPTRPITSAEADAPIDRAYLRAPALPAFPFPTAAALEYLHGSFVLSPDDESAIVEAAAIRYGKQPLSEQDGSYQWAIDCEVVRFFESAGDDEPNGRCDWMGVER